MVDVDAVTIRRWVLGIFSPSTVNSRRLADIYGVGVEDLATSNPSWLATRRARGIVWRRCPARYAASIPVQSFRLRRVPKRSPFGTPDSSGSGG